MAKAGRAWRRHHYARMKAKVTQPGIRRFWGFYEPEDVLDGRRVGRYARTRKGCSCSMCCNPRRYDAADITLQEQRANDSYRYSLREDI